MKFLSKAVFIGGLFLCALGHAESGPRALRVLAIGNSYTQSLMPELPLVAKAAGCNLDLAIFAIGGKSLSNHWVNCETALKDPSFTPYLVNGKKTNLPKILSEGKWDVVTFQEQSVDGMFPEKFNPWADRLIAYIRARQPHARLFFQLTWSDTVASHRMTEGSRVGTLNLTPDQMYAALEKNYVAQAKRFDAGLIPVGTALQLYRKQLPVTLHKPTKEALAALKPGELPDLKGELSGWWTWSKGRKHDRDYGSYRLRQDFHHLNKEGKYLQACVWMAALFGVDVTDLPYAPALGEDFLRRAPLIRRCAMEAVRTWCGTARDVGALLKHYVDTGRIAGVVSVTSDAECRERYDCAGWADMEGGRRMTPDTLFAIFSMTKTFTGAAVMCAIDEGRLSLDDAVAKYLPEFADVRMKDGSRPKRGLTIRDITSHVTGFRGGYAVVNRDIPLREVARKLAAQPLQFQPGETFSYGNSWICTAAACVEVATGVPFERYLQTKVLDPLGMKDTTFWPNDEQVARLAKPYNSDDAKLRPAADRCVEQVVFPKKTKIFPAASGGLFSTPRDMVRFSQMLAHHGEWKGKRIISRETFDRIFSVKQTPAGIPQPYTCGSWLYGDWFGHEGAMRTDQRANLKTGHCRVFFIQTENRAGSAFFQLKREWHDACDRLQGTEPTHFGN